MQAIKKAFSNDDDRRSSSSSGRSAEVGNTGALAHNSGPDSHSGAALAHNNPLAHNSTTGITSAAHSIDRTSGSAVGGGGSRDSEGLSTHHETLAKARDGNNGTLSHEHNVGADANIPGEGASHDHRHLAAVTKEKLHHHTTEEVTREREVDRHVHHVQQHIQPVVDVQHNNEEHTEKVHPTTKIHEQHVNTDGDKKIFAGLNTHKDSVTHGEDTHKVIDKGETVRENVSHHVHHVVQPVIERDTHTHHTIHTTIPIHQTTHEAPIIHQSSTHEPMHLKDFIAGGGDIKSKLTHDKAGVLADGDCSRNVDGPGEKLSEKLHLGHSGSVPQQGLTGTSDAQGRKSVGQNLSSGNGHRGAVESGLTGTHSGTASHTSELASGVTGTRASGNGAPTL